MHVTVPRAEAECLHSLYSFIFIIVFNIVFKQAARLRFTHLWQTAHLNKLCDSQDAQAGESKWRRLDASTQSFTYLCSLKGSEEVGWVLSIHSLLWSFLYLEKAETFPVLHWLIRHSFITRYILIQNSREVKLEWAEQQQIYK